jgi:hypothetical protein
MPEQPKIDESASDTGDTVKRVADKLIKETITLRQRARLSAKHESPRTKKNPDTFVRDTMQKLRDKLKE